MSEVIEVKQAIGVDGTQFAFDNVFWTDGGRRRLVAHVGHDDADPIQWRETVPESIKAQIRSVLKKHTTDRKAKDEQAERDRRKSNPGGARPETSVG